MLRISRLTAVFGTVFFALGTSSMSSRAIAASNIVVGSTADTDSNDAICTFREAIAATNTQASYHGCVFSGSGAPTTINFNIAGTGLQEIDITSQLPAFTKPVIVDGLSQPGSSCSAWPPTLLVEIRSPSNGAYSGLGLDPGSGGSTIRGLVINGFNNNSGNNFNFNAAINIFQSNGNRVECNLIGTDASGTSNMANLRGVDINSSSNNIVGSDGTAKSYVARNLISGNQYGQVGTRGAALSGNRISGNFIGTDVTGTLAMSGQSAAEGVAISASPGPATGNFVGWDGIGDLLLMRNIISGFTFNGAGAITMVVGAQGNHVAGNYIGTDVTGSVAIPNFIGVSIGSNSSVFNNIIGNDGTQNVASARNVISGNTFAGVDINGSNGTHDNAVIGNYIGVNAAGSSILGNGQYGVSMDLGSASTLVARNWIAGTGRSIRFFGSGSGSTASFINNSGGSNANLPALDSRDNCLLNSAGGVYILAQGSSVPNPNLFAHNWWGAAGGPNTAGASTADASIAASPVLVAPATICSDVIFANGFEGQ